MTPSATEKTVTEKSFTVPGPASPEPRPLPLAPGRGPSRPARGGTRLALGVLCATVTLGCGSSNSDQSQADADGGVTTPGGTGGATSGGSGGTSVANVGSGGATLIVGSGGAAAVGSGGATAVASGGTTAPDTATGGTTAALGGSGGGPAGGAGTSAGTGGGAPSGGAGGGTAAAGGGPGASGPACGTAKICDDFESYTMPTNLSPWTTTVMAGTVKADTTHAFSGKQSIQIHANPGANSRAQINRTGAPLFPANPNLFWGRMMVYMTALPASAVHYDNVQGDGTGTGQYRIGGMGGILLNYEPHDCYDHIMPMLPQNKWSCWQWLYDGTKNTIEFYVDGALQAKVVNTSQGCVDGTNSVWAAPMFNAVHLGWVNYQATTAAVDLWLDDVALGPDEIACPTAASYPMAH
jgi:hypothetical protein